MWGGETTNQSMRKNQILAAALLCLTMQGHAQTPTKGGGISSEMLTQIERNGVQSSDRVISNALATNKIDDLALNFKEQGRLDTYFSVETPAQSIHNQKSSGRCWLFSGLNVLRANFARLHKDSIRVEYSQVYLSFYDQLEKANLMLQGVIDCADKPIDDQRVQFFFKNPLNDGGTFCGAADLAEKYGVVPMEAMPEPYSAENTSRMAELISSKLREFGLELRKMVAAKKSKRDIQARKTEMLGTVYHMLTVSLGNPVKEFTYAFKDKNGKTVAASDSSTPLSGVRVKTAQTTPIALDGVTEGSEYTLTVTGRQSGKAVTVDFQAPAANSADKNNGKPGAGNADKNGVIASGKVNNDTKAGPFGAALLGKTGTAVLAAAVAIAMLVAVAMLIKTVKAAKNDR